jgi:hypothetical protein
MFGWSTLLRNSAIERPQKLFAQNYFAAASPNIAQGARCGLGGIPPSGTSSQTHRSATDRQENFGTGR